MGHSYTFELINSFEAIPAATEGLSRWLEAEQVPPAAAYLATLALEELVTNCIKYGYDDQAEHLIEVTMSITESELVMVFTDDGHSFNPLELSEPDKSLPIEDRAVGGLGIHMLRKMSDRMEYVYSGGKNRITLRKSFGAQI